MPAAVAVLILLFSGYATGAPMNAKLVRMHGDIKTRKSQKEQPVAAKEGMIFSKGAFINTGLNSGAFLAMSGNVVRIDELTVLSLDTLESEGRTPLSTKINLDEGRVFAKVERLKDTNQSFTIRTPMATVGVRGTAFEVSVNSVSVIEGEVTVTTAVSEFVVTAGYMIEIAPDGTIGKALDIPAPALKILIDQDKDCVDILSSAEDKTSSVDKDNIQDNVKDVAQKLEIQNVIENRPPGAVDLQVGIDILVAP
jgi:hypothetical protein